MTLTDASLRRRTALAVAVGAALVAVAAAAIRCLPPRAPTPSPQPGFPRLAAWWPGNVPAAQIARRDYVMLYEADPARPTRDRSAILAANPRIEFMSEGSARELSYSAEGTTGFDRERLGAVPPAWVLLQVGSTLSRPLSATDTVVHVARVDAQRFRPRDLVRVDGEWVRIKAVTPGAPGSVVVKRGVAGSSPAGHRAGTRVNAAVSCWPDSVVLDMTDGCPVGVARGRFASPRPEKAGAWMARRNLGFYRARHYDGIMIDVANESLYKAYRAGGGNGGPIRSIGDADDPNVPVEYAAFDLAWRSGIRRMLAQVRSAEPSAVIIANGSAARGIVTGGGYEDMPRPSLSADQWSQYFFGSRSWPASDSVQYAAWTARPNYTTVVCYAPPSDLRSVRFALTTTLLSDGYFVHRGGSASAPEKDVLHWFDEYDGAGIGKGYLGQPSGPAYGTGPAWRRDFTRGTVVVNPSETTTTVQLGRRYRRIRGRQAPLYNDGRVVTEVDVPAKDGIILTVP